MQDSLKTLTGDVTEPEVFTLLGTVEELTGSDANGNTADDGTISGYQRKM